MPTVTIPVEDIDTAVQIITRHVGASSVMYRSREQRFVGELMRLAREARHHEQQADSHMSQRCGSCGFTLRLHTCPECGETMREGG